MTPSCRDADVNAVMRPSVGDARRPSGVVNPYKRNGPPSLADREFEQPRSNNPVKKPGRRALHARLSRDDGENSLGISEKWSGREDSNLHPSVPKTERSLF